MSNENPILESSNDDGVTRREFLGVDTLLTADGVTAEDVPSGEDIPTTRREFLGGTPDSEVSTLPSTENRDGAQIPTTRRGFFKTILGKSE